MSRLPQRFAKQGQRFASANTRWSFGSRRLCRKRRQSGLAGLLALSALVRTDAAVLVMLRVALAFLAASPTGVDARLKHDSREPGRELGLPTENPAGRHANVAAAQTERDALQHVCDIRLAEVCVGARRAGLSTDEAFVDARSQDARFDRQRPRMGLQ